MRISVALALAFALSCHAHAQIPSGGSGNSSGGGTSYAIGAICAFDMQQYCKDIPARRIRDLRECLARNERNLLPRCQDHYKEAKP